MDVDLDLGDSTGPAGALTDIGAEGGEYDRCQNDRDVRYGYHQG